MGVVRQSHAAFMPVANAGCAGAAAASILLNQSSPFLIFTPHSAGVYGLCLAYDVEVSTVNRRRIMTALADEDFVWYANVTVSASKGSSSTSDSASQAASSSTSEGTRQLAIAVFVALALILLLTCLACLLATFPPKQWRGQGPTLVENTTKDGQTQITIARDTTPPDAAISLALPLDGRSVTIERMAPMPIIPLLVPMRKSPRHKTTRVHASRKGGTACETTPVPFSTVSDENETNQVIAVSTPVNMERLDKLAETPAQRSILHGQELRHELSTPSEPQSSPRKLYGCAAITLGYTTTATFNGPKHSTSATGHRSPSSVLPPAPVTVGDDSRGSDDAVDDAGRSVAYPMFAPVNSLSDGPSSTLRARLYSCQHVSLGRSVDAEPDRNLILCVGNGAPQPTMEEHDDGDPDSPSRV